MNILFVHEVDWLQSLVLDFHNLSELLALKGHNVSAVSYASHWRRLGKLDMGTLRTKQYTMAGRAYRNAEITYYLPGYIKIIGLSRTTAALSHYWAIDRILREKDIDVILLYSVPTNGLQTIHLARKYHIPVIFRSIDILHRLVTYSLLSSATKKLEKTIYANSERILAITPCHEKYVIEMGAEASRVRLLRLPIDTSIFHPAEEDLKLRVTWGLEKADPVILFVGKLYNFSGLDGFIHRFPEILAQIPEAKLLIVGDGPQRLQLERLIQTLNLNNSVRITGVQPYESMPAYMNMASVCINPFLVTEETKEIFPGKIIQYIACGRATVARPSLGITSLISDKTGGILYAGSDAEFAQAVINVLRYPELRRQLEHAGLAYVQREHAHQVIAQELESNLTEVVASYRERRFGRTSPKAGN